MNVRGVLAAAPVVLLGSQAVAENWVTVATQHNIGHIYSVDKDSVRRGDDGLVYFRTHDELSTDDRAADCPRLIVYTLDESFGDEPMELTDWRNNGEAVKPGSSQEAELRFACASAG